MSNYVLENYIKMAEERETKTTKLYKKQEEKNIVDEAHPEKAIVQNSYDSIQGLVENVNEQQKILLNIVNKKPDGQLSNKKYSETKLALSLLKVANTTNNEDLKTLAETCNEQIKKKASWALVGKIALWGIPTLISLIYAQQHLPGIHEGLIISHKELIESLDDLLASDDSNPLLYGASYSTELIKLCNELKVNANNLKEKFDLVVQFVSKIQKPKDGQSAIDILENEKFKNGVESSFKEFDELRTKLIPTFTEKAKLFSDKAFKAMNVKDKGFLTKKIDNTHVLSGGFGLLKDKFDEISKSLEKFNKSLYSIDKLSFTVSETASQVQAKLESAGNKTPDQSGQVKLTPQEEAELKDKLKKDITTDMKKRFGLDEPEKTTKPTTPTAKKPIPQKSLKEIVDRIHYGEPPTL